MLRKRIIGVVCIKDSWVVQSFGYNKYLPIGKLECILENLDRWGVDEILIQVIDRSINNYGPDLELLDKVASLGLGTPIMYSGGIRDEKDAIDVIQRGADRVCVDALFQEDENILRNISYRLGAQALVVSLPLFVELNEVYCLNYIKNIVNDKKDKLYNLIEDNIISEVLAIDMKNEGSLNGFNPQILSYLKDFDVPVIAFGGIDNIEVIRSLLERDNISAIGIGNSLNYREHSVQTIKNELISVAIRPPVYQSYLEI